MSSRKKHLSMSHLDSVVAVDAPLVPACVNCPYWLRNDSLDIGLCRRYPPTLVDASHLTIAGPLARHVVTNRDAVCGEHPLFSRHLQS